MTITTASPVDCERGVNSPRTEAELIQASILPSNAAADAASYNAKLLRFGTASKANRLSDSTTDPPFVLLFRELYAMAIVDLGRQLAEIRSEILEAARHCTGTEDEKSKSDDRRARMLRLLHEYSRTIAEFEEMISRDYYEANPDTRFGQQLVHTLGPTAMQKGEVGRLFRNYQALLVPQKKLALTKQEELRRRVGRFAMAAVGGVLIVVPVVIMSFNPSITKDLITLSVSTLVCASVVAAGTSGESATHEIVTATAAYAAVLAVFLGANNNLN